MPDEITLSPAPTDGDTPISSSDTSRLPTPAIDSADFNSAMNDAVLTTQTASLSQTAAIAESSQPFYLDLRYQILIFDGILALMLLIILTIRLLSKSFASQPTAAPIATVQNSNTANKPQTVDQLNIDIPL